VQGYFHREVFSLCYVLAASWPAFIGKRFVVENQVLAATWAVSCIMMSLFTLLPVVKVESISLMYV
jgi:phosphatidylinositol glycan class N